MITGGDQSYDVAVRLGDGTTTVLASGVMLRMRTALPRPTGESLLRGVVCSVVPAGAFTRHYMVCGEPTSNADV